MADNKAKFEQGKEKTINFMKNSVIAVDEKDQAVWNLITDVPRVGSPMHVVLLILNIIIPGLGTMIVSCYTEKWSKTLFAIGVFQLFLAYILIGWIFSIYWGWLIFQKSTKDPVEIDNFLDNRRLRSDMEATGPG